LASGLSDLLGRQLDYNNLPKFQEETMTFPFTEENTVSRRRLEAILRRLTDEELTRLTPSGWSVSALLAHLAFWDRRVLVLLRRWKEKGVDESPMDSEAMNDALKPIFVAMAPRTAVDLCLASADAVDAELETLTPQLFEEIQASPNHFRFSRALHRNDHLNEIEMLLRSPQAPDGT
jgi:hypothetical protein